MLVSTVARLTTSATSRSSSEASSPPGTTSKSTPLSSPSRSLAARDNPKWRPLIDAMPFEWHGPRRGTYDPREERAPEEEDKPLRVGRPRVLRLRSKRVRRPQARCNTNRATAASERGAAGRGDDRVRPHRTPEQATEPPLPLRALPARRLAPQPLRGLRWETAVLFVILTRRSSPRHRPHRRRRTPRPLGKPIRHSVANSMPARQQIGFTTLPKLLNRDWDILQVAATDPKTRST